jgi:hypothetical protein
MRKLAHSAKTEGLEITPEQLAAETSAAHNTLLTFRGVTPNVGVLGINPREFFEIDNPSPEQPFDTGAADAASRAASIRHLARATTLQTVAEQRLAAAHRTRPTQVDTAALKVHDLVDLYRNPSPKDAPGWRGPAVLLDLDTTVGTAALRWQGRVLDVPLRHVRPHVGYAALCGSSSGGTFGGMHGEFDDGHREG